MPTASSHASANTRAFINITWFGLLISCATPETSVPVAGHAPVCLEESISLLLQRRQGLPLTPQIAVETGVGRQQGALEAGQSIQSVYYAVLRPRRFQNRLGAMCSLTLKNLL